MKVTSQLLKQGFRPCSILIEFHSQLELDAFGALFNCCQISDAAHGFGFRDESFGEPIRDSIENMGGNISTGEVNPSSWADALRK